MNEFKRKIRRGPFERWWSADGIRYVDVPGGVLARLELGTSYDLCFIPGVALMFREYDSVIPADEDEGLDEEEVVIHQVKLVSREEIGHHKGDGWRVFE